jgi:hypothetical protein
VTACAPAELEKAEVWTVANALARKNVNADFGGWSPGRLVVRPGERLPFENENQLGVPGIVIQPGVADGVSAPFVITDVWRNHPTPWVQPVWSPRRLDGRREVPNVFSVDVDSSFYSPFWQLELLLADGFTDTSIRSAREALASSAERQPGPLVYCPVVPLQFADQSMPSVFASSIGGPRDPITLRPVPALVASLAWSETRSIGYLDFGPSRFEQVGQLPQPARAYFFVKRPGDSALPVASVLPSSPKAHAFLQRVDVPWPDGAAVYVPSSRAELREVLVALDVPVARLLPANDEVTDRALQVVLNRACLETGAIADCVWLDRVKAIVDAKLRTVEQPVQIAAGVVSP